MSQAQIGYSFCLEVFEMQTAKSSTNNSSGIYDWSWFLRGMAQLFSLPAIILISAFVGFGGLAREAAIPLSQLLFMVPLIWALPSHLIVLAGIVSGASIPAIALAVALASIRMLPMTMALIPEIRVEGTKRWHLLLVSNLVAITAWVHTLQKAPDIPRPGRLPYFAGFAFIMMVSTTTVAGVVYQLSASFPPMIMAALYFLTPLYFATSIWNSSRLKPEYMSLGLGFILGPIFAIVVPQANILLAGFVGGSAAFLFHWIERKRRG